LGLCGALSAAVSALSAAEAAELLSKITEEDRNKLLQEHRAALPQGFILEMDAQLRKKSLEAMSAFEVAAIVSELESDDALDLILNLDPDFQNEIIRNLSSKMRVTLEEGLSFPEDSAGRLMQREFVAIPQFWTVGKTIDYFRAATTTLPEDFFDVFVISTTYRVIGEIPVNRIVRAPRSQKIDSLTLEDIHAIPATMDQEEVAQIFRTEDLMSAPVVDDNGRLIGVITIDDIVDVIDEEAQEDIMALSGVGESDIHRAVLATSFLRFRWLLVNVFTALAAASIISLFTGTIEKFVALAVLMPIVASMGGNAGMQALTVAVRALATRDLSDANAGRVIVKEILVGALNGSIFAVLVGLAAGLWFQDFMLGMVIGAAMIINLVVAGFFGATIPIALNKIGIDPAAASSVFLTTMTDIIGFLAFLGLATLILIK